MADFHQEPLLTTLHALYETFDTASYLASLERRLMLPRQALHAAGASFPHPATGEPTTLSCPLPSDLRRFWQERARQGQG